MIKSFFYCILIVFLCQCTIAQSIDTLHPEIRFPKSISTYDDSTWTLISSDAIMYFINSKGELIESRELAPDIGNNKIIRGVFDGYSYESDSFLYMHIYDSHCDYTENGRLIKLDKEGVVHDTFYLEGVYFSEGDMVYPSGTGSPKFVYARTDDLVIWYAEDSLQTFPIEYILHIAISESGDIAALTNDSIYYFVKGEEKFELADQVEVNDFRSYFYHDLFFTSGNDLIYVSQKILMWFDSALQNPEVIETVDGFTIDLATETNDQIVVATKDPDGHSYAGVLDFDKQVIYEKQLEYHQLFVNDIIWLMDSIYVFTGSEGYPDDKAYTFLKTIDFGTTTDPKFDVAISDIKFNLVREDGIYQCYYPEHPRFQMENVTVTITNTGHLPVDQLIITSSKSYCYFNCSPQPLYHQELYQMDLSPGESKEFYLGDIEILTESLELDPKLCLVAVQPDMHIDAHHEDNIICFSTTVSTDDEKLISKPTLFPNPVIDVLYLSKYDKVRNITILNASGIRISTIVNFPGEGIDMSQYVPGLYIVELEMNNGERIVDRVVKL